MSRRRDHRTLDLLAWAPPEVAKAFEPEKVRASSLRSMICRAVSVALKDCETDREQIAAEISEYLGEPCQKNVLDAYASEAREDHAIPLVKFMGLVHATRDIRLLQILAQQFGWVVIPERYLGAVEEAMLAAEEEDIKQRRSQARRKWRGA